MSRQRSAAARVMALLMLGCGALNWLALPNISANRRGWSAPSSVNPHLPATTNAVGLASAHEAYGRTAMSFEANEGQFAPEVKFFARGPGYSLFLTADEAVMVLRRPNDEDVSDERRRVRLGLALGARPVDLPRAATLASNTQRAPEEGIEESRDERAVVLRMKLVAANRSARAEQIDELPGTSNYFIGNDPAKWRTGVPRFARVTYREVYPGMDLVYYGNQGQFEYDFVLAPGADPQLIRLSFDGAESVRIDEVGDLIIAASGAEVRQHTPVVYQKVNGVRKAVGARFVMAGLHEVVLKVAAYDTGQPLVIDPVLSYSSYIGGAGRDLGNSIAVDSAGNAFVTGRTNSVNFPVTPGGFQTTPASFDNVFVAKLNPSGSSLVYSTYIGGGGYDEGYGVAVDSEGCAYLTGVTTSHDFPTTPGAFQTSFGGPPQRAFVTKLSASGSVLSYSTYLGGSGADDGFGVAVDSAGNAHVTGLTTSADFPITPGAFQVEFRGGRDGDCEFGDAFVTKLNATGTDLLYSTYLGGARGEVGFGVALDSGDNAYVTGATGSGDFPTSEGAFQTTRGGCFAKICEANFCEDAFVTKLNPTGTESLYSSYLGGFVGDAGHGIAVDFAGNALVTGSTVSPDFPRVNPIQSSFGGYRDAFVSKVNATGSALIYSTFVGGTEDETGLGIGVDTGGNAYVTGYTDSPDFPVVNPIRPFAGFRDAFVIKLSLSGSMLLYSTHFGGSSFEGILSGAIAVDAAGGAYITGETESTDFPTTAGAFQTASGGQSDVFVAKFSGTPPFDKCLQDDSGAGWLAINSMTGEYSMSNCSGFTMGGTGVLSRRGCTITLRDTRPDRRVLATIDTCLQRGTATIKSLSPRVILRIVDRHTAGSTCACR